MFAADSEDGRLQGARSVNYLDRDSSESLASARAYAECDRVAQECMGATGGGEYADGFRAAGERMREEIARLRSGRPRSPLEQEIRDVEVEARTLARVLRAVERAVSALDGVDAVAANSLRSIVTELFGPEDLPLALRVHADDGSRTRLQTTGAPSSRDVSRRDPP